MKPIKLDSEIELKLDENALNFLLEETKTNLNEDSNFKLDYDILYSSLVNLLNSSSHVICNLQKLQNFKQEVSHRIKIIIFI